LMYHLPTHCVIDQDISPLFYYERNMIHHNDIIACQVKVVIVQPGIVDSCKAVPDGPSLAGMIEDLRP